MNKRDYRLIILGLGLGILVVNLIYYFRPIVVEEELSDKEIITRAEALGMVSLKESIQTNIDRETEEKLRKKEETTGEDEKDLPLEKKDEKIEINIEKGENLSEICDKLEELNLIKDSKAFRDKVNDLDLSKSIKYGEFQLDKTMTEEDIIGVITKSKK